MRGVWSLRPEHIRLNSGGEVQVQGVVQAVQYRGAATRIELKLANGDKLLVSGEQRWRYGIQRTADRTNGAGFVVTFGDGAFGTRG